MFCAYIFRPAKNPFQVQTVMYFDGSILYGPLDHQKLFLGVSCVQLEMLKQAEREVQGISVIFTQNSAGASIFWIVITSVTIQYLVHSQSLHVLLPELTVCFHWTDGKREFWKSQRDKNDWDWYTQADLLYNLEWKIIPHT